MVSDAKKYHFSTYSIFDKNALSELVGMMLLRLFIYFLKKITCPKFKTQASMRKRFHG